MKIFFWLFLVVAIWVGLEVYTEGTERAFGGRLAAFTGGTDRRGAPAASPLERLRASMTSAQRERDARARRTLGSDEDDETGPTDDGPSTAEARATLTEAAE